MTGKEALEELLNTLKHWQGRNTIFDKMQSDCILKELDELTKYKRAFEILKDKLYITFREIKNTYHINFETKEDLEDFRFGVSKEEYELLEELMKDEKR